MRLTLVLLLCGGCLDYEHLSAGSMQTEALDGSVRARVRPPAETALALAVEDGGSPPTDDLAGPIDSDLAEAGDLLVASDMACAQHTHSNGLGGTWTDCVPLGTYNDTQAMKACQASFPAANCIVIPVNGGCYGKAIAASNGNWTYFVYYGAFQGKVILPGGDCVLAMGGTVNWN